MRTNSEFRLGNNVYLLLTSQMEARHSLKTKHLHILHNNSLIMQARLVGSVVIAQLHNFMLKSRMETCWEVIPPGINEKKNKTTFPSTN